jgi:hypothetical protein
LGMDYRRAVPAAAGPIVEVLAGGGR